MVINSENIGSEIYKMFHRVSTGLQGKSGAMEDTLETIEEQAKAYADQLKKGGRQVGKTFVPFGTPQNPGLPRTECQYDLNAFRERLQSKAQAGSWQERKKEIENKGPALIAQEERELYLNPGDSIQSEGDLNLMIYCPGPTGVYWLRDLFLNSDDVKEDLKKDDVKFPNLQGYRNGDKPENVFIFTELTEAQIHFYGNPQGTQIPQELASKFAPISKLNLGREFAYSLDGFLQANPNGASGEDLGPREVPYEINGQDGTYHILQPVTDDGLTIFRNLSLEDIKHLARE